MSILKFENRTPRSLSEMQAYMFDTDKTSPDAVFGIGIDENYAAEQMEFVQRMWYREDLAHEYIQVIFAFDVDIPLPISMIVRICREIGYALISDQRQVLGAVHYKDTDKIHCHYMINYVGMDGSLYRQNHSIYFYRMAVDKILAQYGLNPICSNTEIGMRQAS